MSFSKEVFWDSTFPLLRFTGRGAKTFLQGQLTSEILDAKTNSFVYGCWLSTNGFVKALVEVFVREEGADLLVIGGDFNQIYEGFEQVIFPADQVIIDASHRIRRLQLLNLKKPWNQNDVFWLLEKQALPESLESHKKATKEEVEIWRLKQGIPFFPFELNGETNPFELGLFDLVSLDKGCYLGQETIARLLRLTSLKKKLMFWESESKVSVGQKIIQSANDLQKDKNRITGVITSSAKKSSGTFGLALIRSNYCDKDQLLILNSPSKVSLKAPIGFIEINI
tara:strand:- start:556 stop:1401 length:846 start_codon:yes stop_codon:yes gene_type:complete